MVSAEEITNPSRIRLTRGVVPLHQPVHSPCAQQESGYKSKRQGDENAEVQMANSFCHRLIEPQKQQKGGRTQPRQNHAEGPYGAAEKVPAPIGLDAAPGGGIQQVEQEIGQ